VWYSKEWRAVLTGGCFEWYSKEWRDFLCVGLFEVCVVLQRVEGCFVRRAVSRGNQKSEGLFYVGSCFECVWYSKE